MGVIGQYLKSNAGPIAGSMISPLLGAGISGFQTIRNRMWQKKMYEKMLAYNTPARQMDRFRRAGLNPSLMYSQGSPGNAPGFPSGGQATSQPVDIPGAIQKGAQSQLQKQQAGLAAAQQPILKEQLYTEMLKQQQIIADTRKSIAESKYSVAKTKETLTLLDSQQSALEAQIEYNRASASLARSNISLNKLKETLTQKEINGKELINQIEQVKLTYMQSHPGLTLSDSTILKLVMETLNMTIDQLGTLDEKYTQWLKTNHPMIYNMIIPKDKRITIKQSKYPNINRELQK